MSGDTPSKVDKARLRYLARLTEARAELASEAALYAETGSGQALQALRQQVHRLAGAAGSFGFAEISRRAEAADVAAKAVIAGGGDPAQLRALVDTVLAALDDADA